MPGMTKRMQVLLSPEQYRRLEEYAKKRKQSAAAVIRESLEKVLPRKPKAEKAKALERLLTKRLPVKEWEKMEEEIMKGAAKE